MSSQERAQFRATERREKVITLVAAQQEAKTSFQNAID